MKMAKKESGTTNFAVYDYLSSVSPSLAAQFKKETKLKLDKRPAAVPTVTSLFQERAGSPDSGNMSGTPLAKSTPATLSKLHFKFLIIILALSQKKLMGHPIRTRIRMILKWW